jgi:hypothetical protein
MNVFVVTIPRLANQRAVLGVLKTRLGAHLSRKARTSSVPRKNPRRIAASFSSMVLSNGILEYWKNGIMGIRD